MATPNGPGAATAAPAPRRGAAERPSLRLVRQAGNLRPGIIGTVTISLVFSTLFVLAVLQAVLVQGQLKLDKLDRDIRERSAEKARREVQVATAESPDRIQAEAARHGLVGPPEVVFLERATVGTIEAPTRAKTLDLDPAQPSGSEPAASAPTPPAGQTPAVATGTGGAADGTERGAGGT